MESLMVWIAPLLSVFLGPLAMAGNPDLASSRDLRLGDGAPTISESVRRRALAGETVSGLERAAGVKAAKVWAVTVWDVDVTSAWMAVNDNNGYVGRVGSLRASRVISGGEHASGRTIFQMMDVPIVADRWWVVQHQHNAALYDATHGDAWEIAWKGVPEVILGPENEELARKGTQVAWTEGAWLFVPLDGDRTYVEYYAWSDPGGSIPAGMASRMAGGAVSALLDDVESFAQEKSGQSRRGYVRPDHSAL